MKFYLVTVSFLVSEPEEEKKTDDNRYIVKAESMVKALNVGSILYSHGNVEGVSCYEVESFFDSTQPWMSI